MLTKQEIKKFLIDNGFDEELTKTIEGIEYRIVLSSLSMRIDAKILIYAWNNEREYKWIRQRSGYYSEMYIKGGKICGVKR